MLRLLLATGAVTVVSAAASAQVVAGSSFSYTGALTSNGWVAHSGAGNKIINSNGAFATLDQSGGSGEDISMNFAAFGATDTVWCSFTLNVPSGNPVNPDADGLYFIHFKDSTTLFRGRTGLLSPAALGDYAIGIHADSAALSGGVAWPADLSFDTDYTIVFNWDAAAGTSTLWVDPVLVTDPSVTSVGTFTGTLMSAIALRQSNDYTGFINVDNVVVGRSFADVQGAAPTYYTFGAGCAGSVGIPTNTAPALPEIGSTWTMEIGNLPTPEAALLFVGSGTIPPTDLGILGAPGCTAYITTDVLTSFGFGAAGVCTFSIPVPSFSGFIGLQLYTQAGVFEATANPLGIIASDAALTEIGS
ncbi:MAG: hypothetical protein AB7O97_15135 [Planctomycetota bacterium]